VVNAVIKRVLMKSLVKLTRKPQAKVSLEKQEGSVLDVGGGGEGTIAKACGRETVCVDIKKGEILEARSRGAVANWVLCDACSMPFREGVFDVVTFFFSLMYIKTLEKKHAVIVEVRRVLKSSGSIYLWDAIIREKPDLSVVFVETLLPDKRKIYTGYGVRGKEEKEQNLELLSKLAFEAGFKVTRTESHKNWFAARFN
jgi:ubiquinone/menaquinone biosynthesis C-methylase UbiE